MENIGNTKIDIDQLLKDFEMFCEVDLQLADLSTKNHVREVKRFLKQSKLNPYTIKRSDLRSYLSIYNERDPYVYKTVLAALKRFLEIFS